MSAAPDAAARPRIAILGGTGNVGRGLALRWGHAGYDVTIGSRSSEKAAQASAQLNSELGRNAVGHGGYREVAASAPIVVLTVP